MKRTGERIKHKRELLGLTLNEVAEKAGITPSALSQIENAKSFPSIITLKSIADTLNSTVGELIGEHEIQSANPVVNQKEKIFLGQSQSGTLIYQISKPEHRRHMDAYLLRFSNKSGLDGFFRKNRGQIIAYILSGEIVFDLEGKSYHARQGDTLYLQAKMVYELTNSSAGISEVLWIHNILFF